MTDTTNPPAASKTPTHVVYHVRGRKDAKGFWTRIGSAWAHKDGHGFNVQVDTFPLDGRLVLRVVSEKKD